MIEINLLPEELRKKKTKGWGIDFAYFIHLLPILVILLISINIILLVFSVIISYQLRSLNNKWKNLEPQRIALLEFNKEYPIMSADARLIQQLVQQRISWAQKLNKLSQHLPGGIWFNELSVSKKVFNLKCSVVSLEKEEISLINKFMQSLKNDSTFFKDFSNLDLVSTQRKEIGGYDIVDFTLTATLK
ncbi:MAG: PilN domain-containing protein [Candidatus Omnitrophica bacterium]|nr:PilN domain-containing protein [Candidatus Omnitrophota bacterium]